MAQFQNIYPIDLNIKKKGAQELLQPIGEGDANGVRVGAQVFADGAPVTLNGQCVAKVIRADGSTVPLTGTISGNIASVALDQQSCAVEGPIQVAVMWVSGTNVTTLVIAYGTIVNTISGTIIQPSTPIPDLTQLLAEIDAMRQATAAANAAATKAVRYNEAQSLTDTEKARARGNISAPSAADLAATNAELAALADGKAVRYDTAQTLVPSKMRQGRDNLNAAETMEGNIAGSYLINPLLFQRGSLDQGNITTAQYRVVTKHTHVFSFPVTFIAQAGFRFSLDIYTNDGYYYSTVDWTTTNYTLAKNQNFRMTIARVTDIASETADIDAFASGVHMLANQAAVVHYNVTQTLTAAERKQARDNIGAPSAADLAAEAAARKAADSDLRSANTHVYKKLIGKNKANPDNSVIGAIMTNGSINETYDNYLTTDFIEIEENTDYAFTAWSTSNSRIATSRKYVALYDAEKNFIDGTYQNIASGSIVNFNSANAKYCRLASQNNTKKYLSVGTEQPNVFIPYSEEYVSVLHYEDNTIPSSAVIDAVNKTKINMYDSSSDVNGVLMNNGIVNPKADSYKTTDYIQIISGGQYLIQPGCRRFHVYDNEKVSYQDFSTDVTNYIFTSPIDGFIRISYRIATPLTSVTQIATENPTNKIVEGIALSYTQLKQVEDAINNNIPSSILKGKKWAVCGDSFTNSGGTGTTMGSGKYATRPYTYPWIIGTRCDMDIVRFFEGGRTLAFPAEPGTFTNSLTNPNADWYYQNIPEDVDYITIYLGINDEHHSPGSSGGDGEDNTGVIPIGTVDDNTTATYLGAWNVVLTWLITNRPNAHIGIIVTNGIASKDEYRLGQIAIAQKYGIPYIDLNGDARTPAMLRTSNPNIPTAIKQALIAKWAVDTTSNTHPNDAAQLFESTFIENFLRSI